MSQAGREAARAAGEVAAPARRNLLSYVEALPRFGAREACLWREGVRWRRRTYAELHRRILACAAALSAAGLRRGEPVLIQGPDGADWVEAGTPLIKACGLDAVRALKAPTLLVFGDADSIRPAHAVAFFELLGGGQKDAGWDGSGMPASRMAILPATTHYNSFSSPLLAPIITSFLDA